LRILQIGGVIIGGAIVLTIASLIPFSAWELYQFIKYYDGH
jgi:hypothetical protein